MRTAHARLRETRVTIDVATMRRCWQREWELKIPALRVGDQEVAKRLHAGHGLELFGIDEIGIERDRFGIAEKLHQAILDQIVGEHRDAEPALAGAQNAENIVDDEMRLARPLAVARYLDQP